MTSSAMKGLAAGVGIGAVVVGGIFFLNAPKRDRGASTVASVSPAAVNEGLLTGDTIQVYKSPTCGCCGEWVLYMKSQGFTVVVHDIGSDELDRFKAANGVPTGPKNNLASCHTALIRGYVVEGHVPAEEIRQMLASKPKIRGLSVPGMVEGPPGMSSLTPQPYKVVAFTDDGRAYVYSSH